MVAFEQIHEHGLHALGLVKYGLGADLESADIPRVDVIFLEQIMHARQTNRVDIFPVIHEGHLQLAQPDRVLALRRLIINLHVVLVHVSRGEVNLQGMDTHVCLLLRGERGRLKCRLK